MVEVVSFALARSHRARVAAVAARLRVSRSRFVRELIERALLSYERTPADEAKPGE